MFFFRGLRMRLVMRCRSFAHGLFLDSMEQVLEFCKFNGKSIDTKLTVTQILCPHRCVPRREERGMAGESLLGRCLSAASCCRYSRHSFDGNAQSR